MHAVEPAAWIIRRSTRLNQAAADIGIKRSAADAKFGGGGIGSDELVGHGEIILTLIISIKIDHIDALQHPQGN